MALSNSPCQQYVNTLAIVLHDSIDLDLDSIVEIVTKIWQLSVVVHSIVPRLLSIESTDNSNIAIIARVNLGILPPYCRA